MKLKNAIADLFEMFPKDVTPRLVELWIEDLGDMPEQLVVGAILHLRRTATFRPTVGEIRMLISESVCGLPTEEGAWKQVRDALETSYPGQDTSAWDVVHPMVLECVKLVGTWQLRNDEKGKAQDHFRRAYRDRREVTVKDMAAGTVPLPVPSGVVSFSSVPQLRAINEAAS